MLDALSCTRLFVEPRRAQLPHILNDFHTNLLRKLNLKYKKKFRKYRYCSKFLCGSFKRLKNVNLGVKIDQTLRFFFCSVIFFPVQIQDLRKKAAVLILHNIFLDFFL